MVIGQSSTTQAGRAAGVAGETADMGMRRKPPAGVSRGRLLALAVGASLAGSQTAIAQAQGGLEEVLVTATKRAAAIHDVPFSVNAQTEADIRRSGAVNLEDISRSVAGLTIQNLGPGQSQVAVRGVSAGQIIRDQPGVKEQVGVYLDESVISLSLFTPDLDLYDLNRVETLRGPQGTLFGSGSVGGTIRYITNRPDSEALGGSLELDLNALSGGDEGGHLKGMLNVPLNEDAALRIVGYATDYAGFIDALREGAPRQNDVNSGRRSGGRIALDWQATDNLMLSPRILYQEVAADGFNRQEVYNLFANPHTTTRAAIQLGERQQYLLLDEAFKDDIFLADFTLSAIFGPVDMTSITSYTDRNILVSRDSSALAGSVTVHPLGGAGVSVAAVALPSNLQDRTEVKQITQEIRFNSNTEGRLQWLAGIFYSDTERLYRQNLPTPGYDAYIDAALGAGTSAGAANGIAPPDQPYVSRLPYTLEQFALFGETTFDFTPDLHFTAGLRYYQFDEERRFHSGGLFANDCDGDGPGAGCDVVDDTSSSGLTPRLLLSWDVNDELSLNAQASRGFRLGGVNDPLNTLLCGEGDFETFGRFQEFNDEKLWNYEAGLKSRSSIHSFNVSAFYADIEDLQVNLDAGGCSSRVALNVDESHTAGIEVEFDAQLTDALELSLAGSYVQAEFDSTVFHVDGSVVAGLRDNNRLASVPEFQFAAALTYNYFFHLLQADAYVALTYQYVGDRITQPSDQEEGAGDFVSELPYGGATGEEVTPIQLELPAYDIINLNFGFARGDWETVLYINNLTDTNANLSFDRERGGRARLAFRTNQPRTTGLTIRKTF